MMVRGVIKLSFCGPVDLVFYLSKVVVKKDSNNVNLLFDFMFKVKLKVCKGRKHKILLIFRWF